jgi:hypothetical protein
MSNKPKKVIPKSQKIQGKYKLIPENTLLSEEFQSLEPTELKIYMCFITYWIRNGKTRNEVKMTIDFIMKHTRLGRTTIWAKLKTLRQKEFIDYVTIRNETTTYTLSTKYTIDYNN